MTFGEADDWLSAGPNGARNIFGIDFPAPANNLSLNVFYPVTALRGRVALPFVIPNEAEGSAVSLFASAISGSTQSVPNETQHDPFDSAKPQIDYGTGPWQSPPQKQRCAFAAIQPVKGFQTPRAICR